jgi:hypothetical protein
MAVGQKPEQGKANFQVSSKTGGNPNEFNVGDTPVQNPVFASAITDPNARQPEGHTIPNGGGQMPGGDGNSKPATLGGDNPRGVASPGSPGYTTQIEGGMLAGGYSQPGGDLSTSGGGGYNYNRGGGGRMPASGGGGMDLKKYLPGQANSPYHMFVGANGRLLSPEINGPSVDMFQKIHDRIQEKCKFGLLYDCQGK